MRSKLFLSCVVGLFVVVVTASAVLATPQSGFTPAQQWKGEFGELDLKANDAKPFQVKLKTKGDTDVYVTRNAIAVGGQSGWHTHPGPSLIIVTAGRVTAYDGDDASCTPKVYETGTGFVDPGDGHVHLLRNEGTEPAETVAVQFLARGATRRIDIPVAPGNCAF